MKTVTLPGGESVPAFGMGTWYMGENLSTRTEEIATLRLGLDLGLGLIDTAEMYGAGRFTPAGNTVNSASRRPC